MTKLDSKLNSRYIISPKHVHIVIAMVFPGVMYRCESWAIRLSTKELVLLTCGAREDS